MITKEELAAKIYLGLNFDDFDDFDVACVAIVNLNNDALVKVGRISSEERKMLKEKAIDNCSAACLEVSK